MTATPLPRHTLSKSDFKAARTCATKLYYKEHRYPDNRENDPYLRMLARGGYMVEMAAKLEFPEGTILEYGRDHAQAAATTLERIRAGDVTLFEATLLDDCYLARADVLRRRGNCLELFEVKGGTFDQADGDVRRAKTGSPFRSKTRSKATGTYPILADWREYLEDVTYQVMVLRRLFPDWAVTPHLVLVRKAFEAPVDDLPTWFRIDEYPAADGSLRLRGVTFVGDEAVMRQANLTVAIDVSAEVEELLPEVTAAATRFAESLAPEVQKLEPILGFACRDCEYRTGPDAPRSGFDECWSARPPVEYHVLELYKGAKVDDLIAGGLTSLLEVPEAALRKQGGDLGVEGARRLVQIDSCRNGVEWFDPSVRLAMDGAAWPLHFIDFEAAALAVPHHGGMRPYGQLAFQWSCHTQREHGGPLEHHEWLNEVPTWPNAAFARSLREAVGDDGTILTWSHFEENVLRRVADELVRFGQEDPDLAAWLDRTVGARGGSTGRILDMHKLCLRGYFHPRMGGSTSIKAVLDALWATSPAMRDLFATLTGSAGDPDRGPYAGLPPVVINGVTQHVMEGTGAVRAYEAMMYGVERNDEAVKEGWRTLLRQYCHLDTLAMVLIWEHWRNHP